MWWFIREATIVLIVHTLAHSIACENLHNCDLPKIITWFKLGGNKDVNKLAEYVYTCRWNEQVAMTKIKGEGHDFYCVVMITLYANKADGATADAVRFPQDC